MQYSWASHVAFPDIKYILGMNIVFTRWIRFQQECYHTAENFRGRKLLRISRFCGYTQKFSPRNLGRGIVWHSKSDQSTKVFSTKNVFFTNSRKFSPSKVSRYTVYDSVVYCLTRSQKSLGFEFQMVLNFYVDLFLTLLPVVLLVSTCYSN